MRNDSLNDEKSVMVVDDDTSVRESMSRLLEAKAIAFCRQIMVKLRWTF